MWTPVRRIAPLRYSLRGCKDLSSLGQIHCWIHAAPGDLERNRKAVRNQIPWEGLALWPYNEDEVSHPTLHHGILFPLHYQHHEILNMFLLINHRTGLISSLIPFSSWSLSPFCPNHNFQGRELTREVSELTQTRKTVTQKQLVLPMSPACIRCVEAKDTSGTFSVCKAPRGVDMGSISTRGHSCCCYLRPG